MEAALRIFTLSFLLSLLSANPDVIDSRSRPNLAPGQVGKFPPSCNRIECPSYELVNSGNGYEIRRYNTTVWISTEPIKDASLVKATRTSFSQLFGYIQGNNDYHQKIEMTAPVIAQVSPSNGPLCESSFTVSFYVPKQNQPDPAPAKNLHVQRWDTRYVAVKQFGGYVSDDSVGEEAAELEESLKGTVWGKAIAKSREAGGLGSTSAYTVAQYNSPFEFLGRVNEIWLPFQMDK
ncbi:hypothetical protein IGI04_029076 [Brassica rapa subsp. trilocularis]|uniref:SOUL heme-binding protein n=3 Tax=Brassica TaxID=3705 RepID=A0A3P6BJ68_BRACM|nr:heme-binding protein 2 [Brassica rapa]KAG5381234.1 hypothetical protein IGI04_029076 [Brassica rapa subsp. trilocularis]CAF2206316.1 unnamed protein product [Brassica napus]CAG7904920.1 unnamed protein product [Brassica rapa]CDY52440.1 BnaA07g39170D [Brassica napus]VDD02406.1 unnamed protein product [Brassica rapa]